MLLAGLDTGEKGMVARTTSASNAGTICGPSPPALPNQSYVSVSCTLYVLNIFERRITIIARDKRSRQVLTHIILGLCPRDFA